ncbi:MAG: hypothetical protein NTX59_01565 [Elusimicrobia bacterium]|nr:hypothetical protein [Elusimicrobiota bacterium]
MNKTILKLVLFFSLQPLAFSFLSAGVPLKINFQGRLEESGVPVDGQRSFVFNIYDAMSGGSLIWTSQAQDVPVSDGVFSVALETGTPVNLSTAAFTGARYVEIVVGPQTLSPRQEMLSAPYALVAQALSSDARVSLSSLEPGSLGANVVISSIAVNAVYDGAIVGMSSAKLAGSVPAGNLGNAVLKAGDIMTGALVVNAPSAFTTGNQPALVFSTNVVVSASQLRIGNFAAAPPAGGMGSGSVYYNTTDTLLYVSNGVSWNSLASGGASPWATGGGVVTLVDPSNNVGVGKAPVEKLDVAGNIKTDSGIIGATLNLSGSAGISGSLTASSGTFYNNAAVKGVIIAGSGNNQITTAAGLLDAGKLTNALPAISGANLTNINATSIADNSITTTKIADANVTAAKLGVAAIDANGKIGAIDASHFASLDGSALTNVNSAQFASVATATTTIKGQINSVAVDTGTLYGRFTSVATDTTTLKSQINSVAVDTGTLYGRFTSVATDTTTLKSQINSVAVDTGTLYGKFEAGAYENVRVGSATIAYSLDTVAVGTAEGVRVGTATIANSLATTAVGTAEGIRVGTATIAYSLASTAIGMAEGVRVGTATIAYSLGAAATGTAEGVRVGTATVATNIPKFPVSTAASDITLTSADFGKTITVTAAATVTLPTVGDTDVGATITVVKLGAGEVIIKAVSPAAIADSSTGGTIYNNVPAETYATITLRLTTATMWSALGGNGSWTTN